MKKVEAKSITLTLSFQGHSLSKSHYITTGIEEIAKVAKHKTSRHRALTGFYHLVECSLKESMLLHDKIVHPIFPHE